MTMFAVGDVSASVLATFGVTTDKRSEPVDMPKEWTHVAERMTRGDEAFCDGAVGPNRIPARRSDCRHPS